MKKFIVSTCVITMLALTGCGGSKTETQENPETQTQTQTEAEAERPESTDNSADTQKQTATPKATKKPFDTSVVSGYYLSMGEMKGNVVIEGDNRDNDEVEISNDKLILPRGTIRTVVVKDDAKGERFVEPTKDEVLNLVSAIEEAECKGVTKTNQKTTKTQEVSLVYETSDDDLHTIHIQRSKGNKYLLRVQEDDKDEFAELDDISVRNSDREYDVVQIDSEKVTTILEKWLAK